MLVARFMMHYYNDVYHSCPENFSNGGKKTFFKLLSCKKLRWFLVFNVLGSFNKGLSVHKADLVRHSSTAY